MANEPNNPAGRLLALIRRGQNFRKDVRAADQWRRLLEFPEIDDPHEEYLSEELSNAKLFERVAAVMTLPEAIREATLRVPGVNHELLLQKMPIIEDALSSVNLDGAWSAVMGPIGADAIYALEVLDDLLSKQSGEPTLDPDVVVGLLRDVTSLLESVLNDDELDPSLRAYIASHLADIEAALRRYQIDGIAPLRSAMERAVGEVVVDATVRAAAEAQPEKLSKLWQIIGRIAIAVNLANAALELPVNVAEALNAGQDAPKEIPAQQPPTKP